jgi:HTH-type transcriptional regulator, bacterioopsin transcriptional activator and related proteins
MTSPPESADESDSHSSGSIPNPLDEHGFVEAAFDALPTQIAVLDGVGDIVYTNEAWRRFGESNGIAGPTHTLGINYFEVCEQGDNEHAAAAASGIRAVLDTSRSQFNFEYPCHSDDEQRWFTMRAIRFEHDGTDFVLVLHLPITERKRSELRVEEQNDELETVNRINSLVRDIIDSLLSGVTRREIETAVCKKLAASSLFHSAYLVERTLDDCGVSVRTTAGLPAESVETLAGLEHAALKESGLRQAIDGDRSTTVSTSLSTGSLPDPLAAVADEHGYESHLVVPIRYRETTYGALVVNAAERNAFSDRERAAFDVLGDAIGYAYNAIESRLILHANSVTELVFEVPETESVLAALATSTDATITLEGVVPASDGGLRCYVTAEHSRADDVVEVVDRLEGIAAAHVINDRSNSILLECTIRAGSPLIPLVEYGATVDTAQARAGALELTAIVGTERDVRSVVEAVRSVHPGVSLRSKRRTERSIRSVREFRNELDDRLTDRQRDILEAAYFAGYFERPRESTGGEIADSFDISSPTFHQHLQMALNKLTELAVDQE